MNRTAVVVVLLFLGTPIAIYCVFAIVITRTMERVVKMPWADGGTIASVPEEFPAREQNAKLLRMHCTRAPDGRS